MKKYFYIGSFFCILCFLSGCTKSMPEGSYSFEQTPTKEDEVLFPAETNPVSPTSEPTETPEVTAMPFPELGESEDYFVYSLYYEDRTMMLYLVDQDLQFEILPDVEIRDFALSSRNLLAYCVIEDDEEILFLSEYPFSGKSTQIISKGKSEYRNFSWSLNGQYLAFTQETNGETKLMIWNGYTIFPIYKINHRIWGLEWNLDNKLTFTEYGLESKGDDPCEILVWDGLEILNVSQNPTGRDDYPVWSRDGRLAFRSERNNEFDIFIWDGHSIVDNLPDYENYQNILSEKTIYHSRPSWTNEDDISFVGVDEVFIVSDGKIKIISQDGLMDFTGPVWSNDGYIALYSLYGGPTFIYVLDETNKMTLKIDGQYTPAWGNYGDLLFCQYKDNKWVMNMWDREQIIEIDRGYGIEAQWKNGQIVYCGGG